MDASRSFIAYVDLLGVGDMTAEETDTYYDQLHRFRAALCDAVDRHLKGTDKVFAFSDCAFAASTNLDRLVSYLRWLQYRLWEHNIFLKGAISIGEPTSHAFSALPGQAAHRLAERKKKLEGYWFAKEFVRPALMEKNLKGIAIEVDPKIPTKDLALQNVVYSCFFPTDSTKRPVAIRDLLIPEPHLPALEQLLRHYMLVSHGSKRLSRYYVPLIMTWIRSHDYSKIEINAVTGEIRDAPTPFRQLILNTKIASEVIALTGGDVIFYALLAAVAEECTAVRVVERVFDFIAGNKKLRAAAEHIPDDVCPLVIRRRMIDTRIQYLFRPRA